jgi:hypothetical protein
MLLEVLLVLVEHTIEPGQKLLGAMVSVEDNGNAISRGNGSNVVGSGDRTSNRSLLVLVVDALAGKEGRAALRALEDDGRVVIASSFESSYNGR